MKFLKFLFLSVFTAILFSSHVPFLKPNQFVILHNRFHVESSFTEEPFQADFAMKAPHYYLIDPNGNQLDVAPSASTKAAVYIEPKIIKEGTYRINASQRKGPNYRGVETSEEKIYFSDDTLKVQGKKITLQYFSSADTYVCKGAANYKPMLLNSGLEIIPSSSPNKIKVNKAIKFKVYQDGIPVPNARIVVGYNNDHYYQKESIDFYHVEDQRKNNIYADKNGTFLFTPEKPGLILLFVTIHKRITDTHWESYNNSLTLEAKLN